VTRTGIALMVTLGADAIVVSVITISAIVAAAQGADGAGFLFGLAAAGGGGLLCAVATVPRAAGRPTGPLIRRTAAGVIVGGVVTSVGSLVMLLVAATPAETLGSVALAVLGAAVTAVYLVLLRVHRKRGAADRQPGDEGSHTT
jgi:hypothetical protein